MERKKIDYVIEKHIGTLSKSGDYSKEVCLVRWKGGSPKLDLRLWKDFKDEKNRKPLKGVSINSEEVGTLKKMLNNIFELWK